MNHEKFNDALMSQYELLQGQYVGNLQKKVHCMVTRVPVIPFVRPQWFLGCGIFVGEALPFGLLRDNVEFSSCLQFLSLAQWLSLCDDFVYRRNHSVASGGLTLDGCQEFDTDSNLSKTCSACGCHRSFHSRLTENQKLENIPPLITQVASTALATSTQFLSPSSGILTSLSPDDSWYNFLEPCSISLNGTPVLTIVDLGQFEVKVR